MTPALQAMLVVVQAICHTACVPLVRRRGRSVIDYAAEESEVRQVLEDRIAMLEEKAARMQVRTQGCPAPRVLGKVSCFGVAFGLGKVSFFGVAFG
jgi:hypothetical protein